jgi:Icc-related predicted phosphoesterase
MDRAMVGFGREMPLVLVSHSPPKNTRLDMVWSGEHVGSIAVRNFIEKFKPALVISGHVHEARGIDSVGETTLVNTGPALAGNYAEIRLEDKVTVSLGNFH